MTELVEKVARAIALAPFDGNEAFIDMATNTKAGRARRLREAAAAIEAMRPEIEREIADWLKKENGLCDCHARSEGECGCGAWNDYKTWPLERVWEAIEAGEHRSKP